VIRGNRRFGRAGQTFGFTVVKAPSEFAAADHWWRAEFAAKCAQVALPLVRDAWPDCPHETEKAMNRSVELALDAARNQLVPPELSKLSLACRICAGAVLRPFFPNAPRMDEPLPPTPENCRVVHLIANSVANASESVESGESAAWFAFQGYGFAIEAAEATRNFEAYKRLQGLRVEYFPNYG